jgi:aspartokinase-like uncharacterized kinase
MNSSMVVKVGGSLDDLPRLGDRLRDWLTRQQARRLLLVPGGGAAVERLRERDRLYPLGEERCHWLALGILAARAIWLSRLLHPLATTIVDHPATVAPGQLAILDALAFARHDQGQPGELPHSWDVTSDSIAARAAYLGGFHRLLLLKSLEHGGLFDWTEAAQRGWVDAYFPRAIGNQTHVEIVAFRALPLPEDRPVTWPRMTQRGG